MQNAKVRSKTGGLKRGKCPFEKAIHRNLKAICIGNSQ
ncbi:hypothetical protein KKC1_31180 [Calderihabitans maritimus]|uniref:Uncharacterized protein n=1 Tax=Calderihabitans maritimus TaxID=1246530 RepID=A0A1Z5HX54_9FIRM|nr:hypothetical protein KKC1_31180 [Calderihabitans maritimus]